MDNARDLSVEKINEFFSYNKGGFIFRIKSPRPHTCFRLITGKCHGHTIVRHEKRCYFVHRVIWIMFNGEIPAGYEIDHINSIRNDNRIENLRLAKRSENMQNIKIANSNSKTGVLGVSYCKTRDLYQASISINRKYHRRFFDTIEEASEWYLNKKREIHPFSTI